MHDGLKIQDYSHSGFKSTCYNISYFPPSLAAMMNDLSGYRNLYHDAVVGDNLFSNISSTLWDLHCHSIFYLWFSQVSDLHIPNCLCHCVRVL